ncbi:hypothetical protein [Maridesulfovibrio zosterae]|uniref:hypothetical protein n=1 Tax=Maridesulfovibrio zosterae TaxID=82171 RepID=UPI000415560D|nr:hypothetical protein [Maridesulfovibrio zosterae]
MSNEEYSDTIYGQVIPFNCELDESYQLAILVDSEEEYIVEPDSKGRGLDEYMDRWVKADVLIAENDDGIFVKIQDVEPEDMGWQYSEDSW